MAVQYAKAMGMNVAAVDIDDEKLALARKLGATVTVNAATDPDPPPRSSAKPMARAGRAGHRRRPQGVRAGHRHGRAGGTVALNGLPPGISRWISSAWS